MKNKTQSCPQGLLGPSDEKELDLLAQRGQVLLWKSGHSVLGDLGNSSEGQQQSQIFKCKRDYNTNEKKKDIFNKRSMKQVMGCKRQSVGNRGFCGTEAQGGAGRDVETEEEQRSQNRKNFIIHEKE